VTERHPDARRTERLARPSGVRFTLADYQRQRVAQREIIAELFDLTWQEINCWRMFGIRADWFMDELVIIAP
jgi:hypothetical protein